MRVRPTRGVARLEALYHIVCHGVGPGLRAGTGLYRCSCSFDWHGSLPPGSRGVVHMLHYQSVGEWGRMYSAGWIMPGHPGWWGVYLRLFVHGARGYDY